MELKGVYTALITPFKNGTLDEEGLKRLIEFQLQGGVDGIVPCGTTGEASTLSYEEHERVIELTVKFVNGKVPVIAGTGSNSTHETVELTEKAKKLGSDLSLLVAPYYNRPTQEGLYSHFRKVAEEVDIPIVLYNIPTRTGVNMLPELVARLAEIPNIVAIKEASGSLQQVADIYRLTKGRFTILSGDDNIFLPMMALGARGVISVLSNILPQKLKMLSKAFLDEKDIEKARALHMELMPLFQAMFVEVNPVPVKESLYYMGLVEKELRLPLVPLTDKNREYLKTVLREFGLLKRNE
ncbi:MAG TPA: 4-hydroxy-tetrahydrodipicolinate synthase [Syntrophorhabdales bacterium]|nr:4-hydroxy-tetrahydrodipicolinate synthase [Syntrophorhabdales bacterium]